MGDLASRIEITKLAHQLGADETDLAFLAAGSAAELRDLRAHVSNALFARHEERVRRLASLSRLLPVPLTAKIAEFALGPMLSARVAGALDPREAARLAGHLDAGFLTRLAVSLDPVRVAPIVSLLPRNLVVDIGTRLRDRGEFLVLGRFVSVVEVETALDVVAGASEDALLKVALFTDDQKALDAIVARLDDETLGGVIRAADETDAWDAAVTILSSLSLESRTRLVAQAGVIAPQSRDSLIAAVAKHDLWPVVLPALHSLEQSTLTGLVNVPSMLEVALLDRVVEVARAGGHAPVLVQLVLALDDEHLRILQESKTLRDPEVQEWLVAEAGVARRLVLAVLTQLELIPR